MSQSPGSAAAPEPPAPASAAAPAPATRPISGAALLASVNQLRGQVCAMGVGLLLVSVCFSAFVFVQNGVVRANAENRLRQIKPLQEFDDRAHLALQELARYSADRPDLAALFTKYHMKINETETPAAPSSK